MNVERMLKHRRGPAVTCKPDDAVTVVAKLLTHHRIGALPVMEKGRLKDMLSQRDVMEARIEETRLEADVLRDAVRARA